MKKFFTIYFLLAIFGLSANAQWVTQNSTTTDKLASVFFTDSINGFASGFNTANYSEILLKTTNGGATWTPLNFNGLPFSIFFTDANNGYIGGYDTIYKTTNAGASWSKYYIDNYDAFTIYFYNSSIGYVSGGNFPSGPITTYYTTNAGASWTAASTGGLCASDGSNCIFCTSVDTCYIVGWEGKLSPGSEMERTTNGGVTWDTLYIPPTQDYTSVFFTNSKTGFVAGCSQNIYKTTNGGSTWNIVYGNGGTQCGKNRRTITSLYFTGATTGYAVGDTIGGNIVNVIKTTDGGNTWNPMTTATATEINSIYFPTTTTGYAVGYSGTIIKYGRNSTGIDVINNNESNIAVYPNPANDVITIDFKGYTGKEKTVIELYNITGGLIKTQIIQSALMQVNISDLAEGVYIVKVINDDGVVVKRVVKE